MINNNSIHFIREFIDDDSFLDLPISTRLLYIYLVLFMDNRGIVINPKALTRIVGATEYELELLTSEGYIKPHEYGCVVCGFAGAENKKEV